MSISGLINSSSPNDIKNLLNSAFSDKITVSTDEYNTIKIAVNNNIIFKLATLYNGFIPDYIYNSAGQIIKNFNSGLPAGKISVVTSSNGFIIEAQKGSNKALYFLTFNSDGTIIYGGTSEIDVASYSFGAFKTTTWDTTAVTTTSTSLQMNSTALVNLAYYGTFGQNSIAEKAYYALYNQYPTACGIATLNNKNYIMINCFYISD